MMRSTAREALVQLLVLLRPSWDAAGVRKVLDSPDLARASETAISIAAVRAAADPNNRTPAVIALKGAHWEEVAGKASAKLPPRFVPPPPLTDAEREAAAEGAARARRTLARVGGGE